MSSLSRRKISLKIPLSSPELSCTDESSENTPGQHGGSLQTRFIESMRAHVITIYGKRMGRPLQSYKTLCDVRLVSKIARRFDCFIVNLSIPSLLANRTVCLVGKAFRVVITGICKSTPVKISFLSSVRSKVSFWHSVASGNGRFKDKMAAILLF